MKSAESRVAPVSEYYIYSPSRTAQEAFLYPLQCGAFVYEPGYRLRRRSFDSFLLMYIQKGSMLLDYGGRQQEVRENTFVLLDCYEPHGYATETGYSCLWLHFDGVMARKYYQIIRERLGHVFLLEDPLFALGRLQAILRVFHEHQTMQEPLMSRYITDILTEFMVSSPERDSARNDTDVTERAVNYINEHFREDLSVDQLAAISGLSRYYFIRVFKQETGYTPHEYLMNRRMATARYLLKYTSMSSKAICFESGFSGESVFCSAFKKRHGMTPQAYRDDIHVHPAFGAAEKQDSYPGSDREKIERTILKEQAT